MNIFEYPKPFWDYTNHSAYSYKREERDGNIVTEIQVPGKQKEDIEIKYSSENRSYTITIDGREYSSQIYLIKQINPELITATLELGILTITAPILNSDKVIKIT